MPEFIKVSAHSRPTGVAGAIAWTMRVHEYAELQAVGATAINQAIKAIAIARCFVQDDGFDLMIVPSFVTVEIEGEARTAIRLAILKQSATACRVSTSSSYDQRMVIDHRR